MKLSIIILTYDHLDDTQKCLESLQPLMTRGDVEVIVIDNASVDGTPDYIRTHYPNIRLTVNPTNRGVAAARNQEIGRASCRERVYACV